MAHATHTAHASGGPDTVAGHFARRGDGDWEPLLQDSSPLFLAIFRDDKANIEEVLRSQPHLINSMLMLLYWGSEPGAEARQVTVKRRTPLQLAAMFGSLNALKVLLGQGANASIRVPEDDSTAIEVASSFSDPRTASAMVDILRDAEMRQKSTMHQLAARSISAAGYNSVPPQPDRISMQHPSDESFGLSSMEPEMDLNSDEFRIFHFKVTRCSKRFAHDWRSCPFAHPTENARRRDPRIFQYCALSCPDYKQGFCLRGDACSFAHGVFEAHLHPSRYRTQLCKDGPGCHRPVCFFAHRLDELRSPTHTWMPSAEDLLAVGINPIVVSQATSGATTAAANQAADGGLLAAASSSSPTAFPLPPMSTRIPFPAPSLGDPRVIQRQQQQQQLTSSASSTRSTPSPPLAAAATAPPPPPPTTPSALEVDLAGGLGELQPTQKQSPAAAAAAVMAYDELLGSAADFLDGLDAIGHHRPGPGAALSSGGISSCTSPPPVLHHPTASSASNTLPSLVVSSLDNIVSAPFHQRGVGSASSGGTASSTSVPFDSTAGAGVAALQQLVEGGGLNTGSGVGGLGIPDAASTTAAAAAAAAAAETAQQVAGGQAALLGLTAPRMSNAFARRHGLNPRDNPMINLQKLALQQTTSPSAPHQQHQHHGVAAHHGVGDGLDVYAAAPGRYPGGRPPFAQQAGYGAHRPQHSAYQQQQQLQMQQQYLGHPQGSGTGRVVGGGGWNSSAMPYSDAASSFSHGQQLYAPGGGYPQHSQQYGGPLGMTEYDQYGGMVGGSSQQQQAASMAALSQSLAVLNLQQQQQQQQQGGANGGSTRVSGARPNVNGGSHLQSSGLAGF